MNTRRSAWMILLAVTMGLAALPAPAVAAPARPAPAVSVLVERSGGFAGDTETFVATRGTGQRAVARLLSLASHQRFRALGPEYQPADPCCDRYRYRVVVRYADGTAREVSTVDDAPGTPWVLAEVVRLTVLHGAAS